MRFTAVKHPTRRGYAVHDSQPRLKHGDDIEGIGWIAYNPPKVLPPTFGYYRLKSDAQARATVLNQTA